MSSRGYWERFQRERISRRRLLGAMGVGAAGLAVAAACGGEEAPSGGTLVVGSTTTPTFGLDPHTDVALGLIIFPRIYGYMLHQDPRDESILLDHAAQQPEITDDGLTIIIKLRPGIRYQNVRLPGLPDVGAREVVAQDVVASFERYKANLFVTNKIWHETIMERIEAPDPQTVVITQKRPYVYSFETIGGIQAGVIIPEELTDLATVPNLNNGGIGSGPFIADRVDLETEIQIRKNPDYFNQPLPYIERGIFRIIRDPSALKAAFRAQQVDLHVFPGPDKPDADELRGQRSGGWEVIVSETPGLAYASFSMNVSREPFDDVRVRQAVSLAIDRQDLIDRVDFGAAEILGPINHHLRAGFWGLPASELEEAYGLNMSREERLQQARDLLARAGASGAKIEVKFPNLPSTTEGATLAQQHLKAVGLDVTLVPQELVIWFLGYRQGDFQATYQPHLPYETPDIPTRFFYSKGTGVRSFFDYANPEIDALIERSWGQFDAEERKATLLELQRKILQEHGPMLNLFTGVTRTAFWSYVQGLKPDLPGSLQQYIYDQYLTKT